MADQASLKTGSAASGAGTNGHSTPEERVAGGLAGLGNDVATLAELQARLALNDLKECVNQVRVPVALIALGLIVINGAVPVVLLGIAALLATALKLTGWALLLTGATVLASATGVVGAAAMKLGPSATCFRRSQEELTRNVSWIKTVLLYSGRSVPQRSR